MSDLKEAILDAVSEAYNSFIFYDRKLDRELTTKVLTQALVDGVVTPEELGKEFQAWVESTIKHSKECK